MALNRAPILDQERPFELSELFFSITDRRGVITHRNDVFTRISGYAVEELIGAPHSILRHPDMPRVVFKLLWDTIEQGQTIAAYVKNLAKDGRYYWVMAVVTPIENGYLSVRLKPSSPLLPVVTQLYQELLSIERSIEVDPKRRPEAMAASGKRLIERLQTHGFADYQRFMQTALATEMATRFRLLQSTLSGSDSVNPPASDCSRNTSAHDQLSRHAWRNLEATHQQCQQLDSSLQQLFLCLDEFRSMNVMLLEQTQVMNQNACAIRLLSMNASIAAHHIGSRASTLGVVAQALGQISHESKQLIDRLTNSMSNLISSLGNLVFEVAATKLQSEISLSFLQEQLANSGYSNAQDDVRASLQCLFELLHQRSQTVFGNLDSSDALLTKLRCDIESLTRNIKRLQFVQFAGLKESAPLRDADAFRVVFEDARVRIDKTRQECESLYQRAQQNQSRIQAIHAAAPHALLAASQLV